MISSDFKCLRPISLAFFCLITANIACAKTTVGKLTCEYHKNPVGIDVLNPRLSWKIISDETNFIQSAFEIRVAASEKGLYSNKQLTWSTGKVASSQSVNVEYRGPELKSGQRLYWQLRIWGTDGKATKWSEPAFCETGLLQTSDWKATWIASPDDDSKSEKRPSPYMRTEFDVEKDVESARVYVSALGLYELHLNGEKVGEDLFTPGWTSYNKRIQYQTYDVTSILKKKNALGAILGSGWYRGNIGWSGNVNYYGDSLALLVQLEIRFSDGSIKVISSGEEWKASTGAILESEIYNGETFDARLEPIGWDLPGYNDQSWQNVTPIQHTFETLTAPQGPPVRAIQEIDPVEMILTPEGDTVFDMGQNMVGWVRLSVKGQPGQKVVLKFAEVLDKDGNFYIANLRSAKATDTYILKGNGVEIYEPRFTFHGFRYVKVEGYPGIPMFEDLKGIVIHSELQPTGMFACSDSLINKLQQNIKWGQKGNFLDVPTDCPQRDERMGWTGDAQVFSATAAFNYDVASFFTKWMADVAADQLPDGKVTNVVPDVLNGGGGATGWADVALVIPWNMYLAYGDKRILEVQYPSMKAWVEYMRNRAGDDLLWTEDWHFGDWLAYATTHSDYPGATTDKGLIATAYFRYSSFLLSKIAWIIGKEADAKNYGQLSENIKKAFIHEFVTPAGRLVSHTQTAYSLALAFDLLPDDLIPRSASYLADDVKAFGHLTTGFLGTPLLCSSLSDHGYDKLAFMLLNRKEYPSWLYPVTQGATTIWERWDGQKPDGSFQDVGMNSFNHYAYGAIGEWLYTYIAGIKIDEENPGYKHFYLAPHTGGGLTFAKAELDSPYGIIVSEWNETGDKMNYHVQIPPNTSATVILPNSGLNELTVDGVLINPDNGIQIGENSVLELGSGKYTFSWPAGK
ncbi:MAG: glycoside hydrolase family 78 protein [Prolixibacteraceae bacterium]|nr:glycoside hydrolase family 78 protein [Prolixibacteraceae bacterium]